MPELAIAAARLLQFVCAVILCGGPALLLYGLPAAQDVAAWPRPWLRAAAVGLLVGAVAALMAQTAVMTGSDAQAFDLAAILAVLTDSGFGHAVFARLVIGAAALGVTFGGRPSRGLWTVVAVFGALACASFAWSGHGASDEGWPGVVHLAADVCHLLAAAIWLGALAAFLGLARRAPSAVSEQRALHAALARFSGIGSGAVAVLLATGLVNSWFLVGPAHVTALPSTPYGQLLLVKLSLFGGMLMLAAANRFQLTPALNAGLAEGGDTGPPLAALKRSLGVESALGVMVLIAVSVMGALAPLSGGG